MKRCPECGRLGGQHAIGCLATCARDDADEARALPGVTRLQAAEDRPDHEVVRLLERLVDEAKRGELRSIVVVAEQRLTFECLVAGERSALQHLGALCYAQSVLVGGLQ